MFDEFDNNDNNNRSAQPQTIYNELKPNRQMPKWFKIALIAFIVLLFFVGGILIGVFAINDGVELDLLNEVKQYVDKMYYGDIDWDAVDLSTTAAFLASISQFNGIEIKENTEYSPIYGLEIVVGPYSNRYIKSIYSNSSASSISRKCVEFQFQNVKIDEPNGSVIIDGAPLTEDYSLRIQRGDKILGIKKQGSDKRGEYLLLDGMSAAMYANASNLSSCDMLFEREAADGSKRYFVKPLDRGGALYDYSYYNNLGDLSRDAALNSIGYIKFAEFNEEAMAELFLAIESYQNDSKANQLILDLRGNGGGLIKVFQQIAQFFIPQTNVPVMMLEDKNKNNDVLNSLNHSMQGINGNINNTYIGKGKTNDKLLDLVVMVDNSSASASEALAATIRNYNSRAKIVGVDTYGKGVAQGEFELMDGKYTMWMVTAKYYTPLTASDGTLAWRNYHNQTVPIDINLYNGISNADLLKLDRPYYDVSRELITNRAIELILSS